MVVQSFCTNYNCDMVMITMEFMKETVIIVGLAVFAVVAVITIVVWYIIRRKNRTREEEGQEGEGEGEGEGGEGVVAAGQVVGEGDGQKNRTGAVPASAPEVDDDPLGFKALDKSQIVSVLDFKSCPRNDEARQAARRELVIQMLIAESMSK